ncbi:putative Piwi domain, ribonuclease H-like superfamily [Helianthus annuus]|nr:putative Piwi domain, ribonuclease H-like superfamily [Helianthus annuus]
MTKMPSTAAAANHPDHLLLLHVFLSLYSILSLSRNSLQEKTFVSAHLLLLGAVVSLHLEILKMKYSKQVASPPSPRVIPPKFVPLKAHGSNRIPMARRGFGTKGRRIPLLTNHFNIEKPSNTQVEGRVLEPPKLKFGNDKDVLPRDGRWNFKDKTLVAPTLITHWAIVNFCAPCDIRNLCRDLLRCSKAKGIDLREPYTVIQENQQSSRNPASVRVELMFEEIQRKLPGPPRFLLCILPERKNSDIYGPWKRKCLVDHGIVTQCMAPTCIDDQYLTNLLLKINAKMGGLNTLLSVECLQSIPFVSSIPTMIFGMVLSRSGSDVPSTAAIVSSRKWPLICRYRASARAQSARVETIDGLFEPVSPDRDEGMIRELLEDFYQSTSKVKPEHIIIFRDGVSESRLEQVVNVELEQIKQACRFIRDDGWDPKFTVIVTQKAHRTNFLQPKPDANVPPGTIIDTKICHPKNNDFYLCAQNGPLGTVRCTHYHVLLDQIGFSADDLQELVHSLSYVYQTNTTAKSIVAPIWYAQQAAALMSQFVKSDTTSNSSGGGGFTQIPKLHENVCDSMFFC